MLSLLPGEEKVYLSFDSICKANTNIDSINDLYTLELLNTIKLSGISNHELRLKLVAPMLLINIDRLLGICNDNRLLI